jgi:hypothetical protein
MRKKLLWLAMAFALLACTGAGLATRGMAAENVALDGGGTVDPWGVARA